MRVATQGPFAVGIVRWQWPAPGFTVVVKITYGLDRDGRAELSPVQLGLCVDCQGMGVGNELEYPSDFAPLKHRCDVLVVGHGKAAAPSSSIPVEVAVDHFRKAAHVLPSSPSTAAPLAAMTMRCEGGMAGFSPRRSTAQGWRRMASLQQYDFSQFNVAPGDQQVSMIRPDARLVLSGLIEGVPRREVELPGIEPEVLYLPGAESAAAPVPVPLRCDTLWIHADRRLCSLTWRGLVESAPESDSAARLVTVVRTAQPRSTDAIVAAAVDAEWRAPIDRHLVRPGPPVERPLLPGPAAGSHPGASVPPAVGSNPDAAPAWPQPAGPASRGGPAKTMTFEQLSAIGRGTLKIDDRSAGDPFEDDDVETGQFDVPAELERPPESLQVESTQDMPPASSDPPDSEPPTQRPSAVGAVSPAGAEEDVEETQDRDDSGIDDGEEPAPVTPRAGVQLGGMMGGGGLGSMVLSSPTEAKTSLPFEKGEEGGASSDASLRPSPTEDDALPFRSERPSSPGASAPLPPIVGVDPLPAGARDTAVDEGEPSPGSMTGELRVGGAKAALPFQPAASQPPPPENVRRVATGTMALDAIPDFIRTAAAEVAAAETDVGSGTRESAAPSPDKPSDPAAVGRSTMNLPAFSLEDLRNDHLPFGGKQAAKPPATPFEPSPATRPASDLAASLPPAVPTPTPAEAPRAVPAIVPTPSWHPPSVVPSPSGSGEAATPQAGSAGGAPAAEGSKRDGPELTLETYAAIKAKLWDGTVPADEILQEYALDAASWRAIEAKQARAIARDAAAGRAQLAIDIRNAIAEARRRLAGEESEKAELDLDQFAELLVALEDAPNEAVVLEKHEIEPEQWKHPRRKWERQASTDRQVAEELRCKIAQARRSRRS